MEHKVKLTGKDCCCDLNACEVLKEIKRLKGEIAFSKLSALSNIIRYKYGIENTPCLHTEEEEYSIFIEEAYWKLEDPEGQDRYDFSQSELIDMNTEIKALRLIKMIWETIPSI